MPGPLRATLPPATLDGAEPRMDAIPEVGEHTDATPSPRGGPPGSSDMSSATIRTSAGAQLGIGGCRCPMPARRR